MYSVYCKLRDMKGVKDGTVAAATGITRSTFTDWKNGRSAPKKDKLQKIADYFDVPLEYLMTGETYYYNEQTANIAQQIFETPGMRTLFDAARDSRPEDLKMAAELLERLKETNPNG